MKRFKKYFNSKLIFFRLIYSFIPNAKVGAPQVRETEREIKRHFSARLHCGSRSLPFLSLPIQQDAPSELYGPTMLVFTLVAILLYGMKTSGHTVVR